MEKLTYSYLADWIDRQRAEEAESTNAHLAHFEQLRGALVDNLDREPPCDIFVCWKALHKRPVGWEPDINDGVHPKESLI